MKRILLVIAVTLPLAACSKEQPKKVEIRPVRVTSVQHALSGDTISLTGQIQAKDQINLAFRIGGRLQERNVTVGDPVTPEQIVKRNDRDVFRNRVPDRESRSGLRKSHTGECASHRESAERTLEQGLC